MTFRLSIGIIVTMNSKPAAQPNIVTVTNKKSGVTYVYEDIPFWNKEKKRGEHDRKCIGKLDKSGEIVYNEFYRQREQLRQQGVPMVSTTTLVGQSLILDKIIKELRILKVLKEAFGEEDAKRILNLASFSVCEHKALSRSDIWLDDRGKEGLSSQQISDLLPTLDVDKQNIFFSRWFKEHHDKKALLFDISSISSYAQNNTYVERGYNRDKENLEQINLGLLCSHESKVPLWYNQLNGSLSDSIVLEEVATRLQKLGIESVTFVIDRGFYSKVNLQMLISKNFKFCIPVPSRVTWQKELIDTVRHSIRRPQNIILTKEDDESYVYGVTSYSVESYGRTWRHVYFDPVRKEHDVTSLMLKLRKCQEELERGETIESHKHLYKNYFEVKETPVRGRKVLLKEDKVDEYINGYSGYWVILTNAEKDASKALSYYRKRNDVEVHFDDLKNNLDCYRLRVHRERAMSGRLFIHFIALIILTELRKRVQAIPPKERKYWDAEKFLHLVNTYSRIHFHGKYKDQYTTPTKSQRLIFDMLGIPYSLKGKTYNDPEEDVPEWAKNNGD